MDRRRSSRDEAFEDFVLTRRSALVQFAIALTGGDRHSAEDLVQTTLVRLYLAWPKAEVINADAYARRALVNALIDHKRRPFMRRELAVHALPDTTVSDPDVANELQDDELLAALGQLPVRMRAAVVLRHVEGLTVEEAAHDLDCSAGNIKSQTARGLDRLRQILGQQELDRTSDRQSSDGQQRVARADDIVAGGQRCLK